MEMPLSGHMKHALFARFFPVFILFVAALGLRHPYIDQHYEHTFTPDAEICVELTRSFYFFFKDPSAANAPDELDSYPTYFEGPFILAGIYGNVTRKLIQWGILDLPLKDSDNTLVIYSMRHVGWLLGALTLVLVYLLVFRLTGNAWLGLLFSGGYYLFNLQEMYIDLMRVDHFILFAFALIFLACVKLLQRPDKLGPYLLLGAASAVMLPTKMNAPVFFFGPGLALLLIMLSKQIRWKYVPLGLLAFAVVFVAFFFRWFMYPEHVIPTLSEIFEMGKLWVAYWNKHPLDYYAIKQFYDFQPSGIITLFFGLEIVSFLTIAIHGIHTRQKLPLFVVIMFVAYTFYGIISPKVDRYGITYPIYFTVMPAYALYLLQQWLGRASFKRAVGVLALIVMLPITIFHVKKYEAFVQKMAQRDISLQITKVQSAAWMKAHVKPGSHVMIYHPRVNNPPMFDLPARFLEDKLDFQFLHPDEVVNQLPPDKTELLHYANFIVLNSEYYNYHLKTLKRFAEPLADPFLDSANVACFNRYVAGIQLPGRSDKLAAMKELMVPALNNMWSDGVRFNQAMYHQLVNKYAVSHPEAAHLCHYFKQCILNIAPDSVLYFNELNLALAPKHVLWGWQAFFAAIHPYEAARFESPYEDYLCHWMFIYQLPNSPLSTPWPYIAGTSEKDGELDFTVNDMWHIRDFSFQLQISETPDLQWLVSPNLDGFVDKYNRTAYPKFDLDAPMKWLPVSMKKDIANGHLKLGDFDIEPDKDPAFIAGLGQYFRQTAYLMYTDSLTFGEAFKKLDPKVYDKAAKWLDDALGGNGALLNLNFDEFMKVAGIQSFSGDLDKDFNYNLQASYKPTYLKPGRTYYWRVRLKFREQPITEWSEISSFVYKP